MLFRKNKKYWLVITIISVLFFAFAGLGYIQRLRYALISSTESYKVDIIELENKVIKLENKVIKLENKELYLQEKITELENPFQDEIAKLENEIIAQGVHVTNDISVNYGLEVDPSSVSLNNILIGEYDVVGSVRFIVAGHPYGSPGNFYPDNLGATTPSSTLVNSVSNINELRPDLFFTLGDLTYISSEKSFQELHENFLDKINAPVFNAPGNHDFNNGREFYEDEFGQTFYYFKYAKTQIIVLDTEIADCFIVGRQKEMLEQAIATALDDDEISNIFVFFHKVLFLDSGVSLRSRVNGKCKYGTNYLELQDELFLPAAQAKPIYLIAGDVGASGGNLSPFYNKYPDVNLYTLAVGLGDSPDDILLQIDILSSGVEFQIIPIGGNQFSPIEAYTPEYWAISE